MKHNLSVVQVVADRADTLLVVKTGKVEDRYFPPLLAAQVFLHVRGLIHQDCDSLPAPVVNHGFKEGSSQASRRWAFAQEIFSNNGRGTESGHFLEHLVLQVATNIKSEAGDSRPLCGETSWDFVEEPDVFRIRFYEVDKGLICEALRESSALLSRLRYGFDVARVR